MLALLAFTVGARAQPLLLDAVAAEERVYAFRGTDLFIPLAPFDAEALGENAATPWQPRVRLALLSGEMVEHRLFWITARVATSTTDQWLAPAPQLSVIDADANPRDPSLGVIPMPGIGFWAITVPWDDRLPDRLLYTGPVRVPVVWLDAPASAPAAPDESSSILEAAPSLASDPFESWRVALSIGAEVPPAAPDDKQSLADPLALLARTTQLRWLAAIDLLRAHDAELARRITHAFTVCVRADSGELLPAWRRNDPSVAPLLDVLLDPARDLTDRARRAAEWLSQQPSVVAWVVDDAAEVDGTQHARLALANLSPDARAPTLNIGSQVHTVDAPPIEVVELVAPTVGATRIALTSEGNSPPLTLNGTPVRIVAPGLRTGAFLRPWNLASWRRGTPEPAPDSLRTVAQLHQREAGQWELFIECATPASGKADDAPEIVADMVRVHLGPRENPVGIITLHSSGEFEDDAKGALAGIAQPRVSPAEGAGAAWSARLFIPPAAISGQRTLHLALERAVEVRGAAAAEQADGETQRARDATSNLRASWPRAMMPGQTSPGRVLLDLSGWDPAPLAE